MRRIQFANRAPGVILANERQTRSPSNWRGFLFAVIKQSVFRENCFANFFAYLQIKRAASVDMQVSSSSMPERPRAFLPRLRASKSSEGACESLTRFLLCTRNPDRETTSASPMPQSR